MIDQSSYFTVDGGLTISSPITQIELIIPQDSNYVTFYTYNNIPLTTIPHNDDLDFLYNQLDKSAKIPEVASYRKIWHPKIYKGNFKYSGTPGYVVLYHDIHGNRIGYERLKSKYHPISSSKYDLTHAIQEPDDFHYKSEINGCILV